MATGKVAKPADYAIPAGEAFVESFANMTRSMLAQSKALARMVSLAQVLEMDGKRDLDIETDSDDKENAATPHRTGSAYRQKVLNDLRSLDAIVTDLERRAAELRTTIDSERQGVGSMKEMRVAARRQADDLTVLCRNLPQHLPHAVPPSYVLSQSLPPSSTASKRTTNARNSSSCNFDSKGVSCSAEQKDAASRSGLADRSVNHGKETQGGGHGACRVSPSSLSVVPTLELVTVSELESVARSTRGRLTIAVVNDAVTEIQKSVEKRHTFLSKPRAKMSEKLRRRLDEIQQQEVPEHGGEPFLAEADLRALPAFKKGEVTAKALIATLRSLKRLKGVRATGVMTYVVQGTYY